MLLKRVVIVILFLATAVFAATSFPSPSGFINDFAGILTSQDKTDLIQVSQALKKATGAELAVAIVDSVESLSPKEYAVKLFEKWGIGEKGKDNGVLVLLAMKERRIEIEVGYGLEGVLNDALAGKILDNYAVPYFKQGEMATGVLETAKAISQVVSGEQLDLKIVSSTVADNDFMGSLAFVGMIFGSVFLLMIVSLISVRFGKNGIIGITTSFGVVSGGLFGGAMLENMTLAIAGAVIGAIIGLVAGIWLAFFTKFDWQKPPPGGWSNFGGSGRSFGGGGWSSGGSSGGFSGGRSGGGGAGRSW